jgi:nucleoside-diphosphate-sugar epimerase
MYRYLVLESSGFIGQKLCTYLKNKNFDVIEFDLKNHLEEDLRIRNNEKLQESIAKSDFIFFLAFDIGDSKFLNKYSNSKEFLINNTKIISNTFETLEKFNKRFIFISSYLTQNTKHSYGLLKLLGEQFTTALNGFIVRLLNVYSIENVSLRSHVIPDIVYQARRNNKIVLNSTGEEKRQFLYVDDCCEGLCIASQYFEELLNNSDIID